MPLTGLLTRLLTVLLMTLGLTVTVLPPPAQAGDVDHGRVWRKDGRLQPGCHLYRFQYRVRPLAVDPTNDDDWALEVFLSDRRGRGLGAVAKDSAIDPRRGAGTFRLCRQTTVPGKFKLRGKLSVYDDGELVEETWVKPGFFRLRRP
jgi:hypothetical protein